jgi:hypothetical protein
MADLKSLPFPTCVVIETPDKPGLQRRIGSVREAAECLLYGWPEKKGVEHRLALQACYYALQGEGTTRTAYWSFLVAAKEADIFVRETPMNSSEEGS